MVRSNMPLPFIYRFRPGPRKTTDDTTTALPAGRKAANSPQMPAAETVTDTWPDFLSRYEGLTDLICAAAKDGITDRREARYGVLHTWFLANYHAIAPKLRPYLAEAGPHEAALISLVEPASGRRRQMDGFEVILLSSTLGDLLLRDAGGLIEHLSRLSDAVYRCDEDSIVLSAR